MNKITIVLDEAKNRKDYYECAEVLLETGGKKRKYIAELDSVLAAFAKSSSEELRSIRLGRLPMGFYDGTIYDKKGLLNAKVLIILPKSRQIMKYEQTHYDVCVPSLVFYLTVWDSRINITRVFAIKDERPNEKSPLFVYPFGNVNTSSGSVCWGSNRLRTITCLRELDEIVALFLQSECNEDHYRPGESCALDTPLRGLFEMLKEAEHFPDELLIGRNDKYDFHSLGDIMNQLK